jgi:dynein heavy chain
VILRLEALVVYWTKQIKDVLNGQHATDSTENFGPLEEIKFWKDRCDNLSSISGQIKLKDVKEIVDVLEAVKSSFLEQFTRLSILVDEGTLEAQDNLKFLSIISASCKELRDSDLKAITLLFPNMLNSVRLIWANSQFYHTKDRITGLLRKISGEIIKRCSAKISLDDIFHGDVTAAAVLVQDSIDCGEGWKAAYKATCAHVLKFTNKVWDFDQSSIFAQIGKILV